jgi:hypothetical protein
VAKGNICERRKLLLTVLDGVYVSLQDGHAVVTIQPKQAFCAVLSNPFPERLKATA